MSKFLRIDCDWYADGLWDDRGRMIAVDDVPISEPLRDRVRAWNAWFTAAAEPWVKSNPYDWDLHKRTGIDIARCLKRELPEWTVVAFDKLVHVDGTLAVRYPYPGELAKGVDDS